MSDQDLILGLASIILFVLGHFSGVWRERKNKREERIRATVDAFGRIAYKDGQRDGLKAFIQAGAKELHSTDELRDAVARALARYGTAVHPLGKEAGKLLQRADLLQFVQSLDPDKDYHEPDHALLYVG